MIKIRKRRGLRRGRKSGGGNRHGIIIKTPEQIEGIRKASQLTKAVLDLVDERIGEGITTQEIDRWVHEAITDAGAIPATLGYGPAPGRMAFPASCCTSLNEVVCHGIPSENVTLIAGDVVNVDVTSILDGYYGDASRMWCIGEVSDEARRISEVAKACMDLAIDTVKPGADFGAIGYAIEQHARANGFSVVRDFTGHGVGLKFHEAPHVLHFGGPKRGIRMEAGMTFTIEPMINAGKPGTRILDDGWTAVTVDGKLSAQWEHTLLVTEDGVERLTA